MAHARLGDHHDHGADLDLPEDDVTVRFDHAPRSAPGYSLRPKTAAATVQGVAGLNALLTPGRRATHPGKPAHAI